MNKQFFCQIVRVGLLWGLTTVSALALFRGDEFEPRDWKFSEEYFLDKLSFQPRYEYRLKLRNQDRAYLGAGGSITSNDLYIFQEFKAKSDDIELDMREGKNHPLQVTARFVMDEDFDGTYQQFFLGGDIALAEHWDLQVVGEPVPLKEFADFGFGIKREDEHGLYAIQLHLPNFVFDSKNKDDAQFKQQPFNLQWNLQTGLIKSTEIWFKGDFDFPSKTEFPEEGFLFDFEKYQTRFGIDYHRTENHLLRLEAGNEIAEKVRRGSEPLDPAVYDIDREFWSVLVEYIVQGKGGSRYAAGYEFVRFDETNFFPNDLKQSFDIDRYDNIVYGTYARPVYRDFFMGTGLYLQWLDINQDVVLKEKPNVTVSESELRGKWSLEFILHSDTYHVALGPSLDLDEFKFGGGYLNVYFDF